jgi:hypothetical protein
MQSSIIESWNDELPAPKSKKETKETRIRKYSLVCEFGSRTNDSSHIFTSRVTSTLCDGLEALEVGSSQETKSVLWKRNRQAALKPIQKPKRAMPKRLSPAPSTSIYQPGVRFPPRARVTRWDVDRLIFFVSYSLCSPPFIMYIFSLSLPISVADKLFVFSELFIFISLHESDHGSVFLGFSFFLSCYPVGRMGLCVFVGKRREGRARKENPFPRQGVD